MSHNHHNEHHNMMYSDPVLSREFCSGGGMVMAMDGFTWHLLKNNSMCLNLFFTSWTLDSRAKFLLAMGFIFFLGIFVEYLTYKRKEIWLSLKIRAKSNVVATRSIVVLTVSFGLQILIGYLLMLAAMTYSLELLLCAVTGLMIGHLKFSILNGLPPPLQSDPCCNDQDLDLVEEDDPTSPLLMSYRNSLTGEDLSNIEQKKSG